MVGRQRLVGAGAVAAAMIAVTACGSTGPDVGSGATTTTTSTTVAAAGAEAPTPPGSTPSSPGTVPAGTAPAAPGSGIDGTYVLTGTQSCFVPGGSPAVTDSPLFEGSSLTFAGDQVEVLLRNDPLTVPVTVDGSSFEVAVVFDLGGNLKTGPPSSTDLPVAVEGTTGDGGETIRGTGSDAGVNCRYTFTGTRRTASPAG